MALKNKSRLSDEIPSSEDPTSISNLYTKNFNNIILKKMRTKQCITIFKRTTKVTLKTIKDNIGSILVRDSNQTANRKLWVQVFLIQSRGLHQNYYK